MGGANWAAPIGNKIPGAELGNWAISVLAGGAAQPWMVCAGFPGGLHRDPVHGNLRRVVPSASNGDPGHWTLMSMPPTIRIFFSSPGDVKMERETARRIVERLGAELGERAVLQPYFWEHEVLLATKDYQQNIPPMDGFSVVVCILWSRLGSPLDPTRHPRPDGGFFESGTEYEFFMAMQAHRSKGAPDVLVFRNRTEPRRPSRPKEAREAVDREVDRLDQFFERYFKEGNFFTGAINSYRTLGEFEEKLTLGLRGFLEQHLPPAGPKVRTQAVYAGRPYLGLAAFDFADAPVFFGRTAQVGEVILAFQTQELEARAAGDEGRRFVLVLGSSGSGKSSLARAGVLPLLVQPGVIEGAAAWRRAIFQPAQAGGDPFVSLASALLAPHALPELGSDGSTAVVLAGLLRRQPGGAGLLLRQALSQAGASARHAQEQRLREELHKLESDQREEDALEVRARLARLGPPSMLLALACDQLEELFTSDLPAEAKAAFVECLASLAQCGRVFVLGTLRSDFYPRCLEYPRLVELMRGNGTYALPAPSPTELGQMIRQPALAAGLVFEERAATGEKLDELLRDAAVRDPGALPLLSYALEQLYERRSPEGVLSLSVYHELGGLEGAIGKRAETVFSALPAHAQAEFDGVWRQLVTLGEAGAAVRRRALYSSLSSGPGAAALVDALVAARLLTADQTQGGERSISVAHEALLRHWPRMLAWVEENRDFLRARARLAARFAEWQEKARSAHYLIPAGPALGEAESLLTRHATALDAPEIEYIQTSAARARERELRRLRQSRLVAAGAVLLSIAALISGAFAWRERDVARAERTTAEEQKRAADANAAAARASQTRAAYLQGIEMLEAGKTRAGLTRLSQALTLDPTHQGARDRLYSYHLYGLPKAICLLSVEAPAGSRQRISGSTMGPVQRCTYLDARAAPEVIELKTRRVVPGPWTEQPVLAAVLNRGSSLLMCVGSDRTFRVWSIESKSSSPVIQHDTSWNLVEFSEDGRWLAVGDLSGRVVVHRLSDGSVAHTWTQDGPVVTMDFDLTGNLLAVAGDELVVFDLIAGSERSRTKENDWRCVRARFAKEGNLYAIEQVPRTKGEFWGRFVFCDRETGLPVPATRELASTSEILDFCLNADGSQIAVANLSNLAQIWHRDDASLDQSFHHDTYPTLVRFTPDGRHLVSGTPDGTVRIWDVKSKSLAFEPISSDGRLEDLEVSWDGRFLLTSTARHARAWDLSVGRALTLPLVAMGSPLAISCDLNGRQMWTAASVSGLQAWDLKSLEPLGPSLLADQEVSACLFDSAGLRAAVLLGGKSIGLVDLAAARLVGEPRVLEVGAYAWGMSGDGTICALADGPVVHFLDTASGLPKHQAWQLKSAPQAVLGNSDGSLAVALVDGQPIVHDLGTGRDTVLSPPQAVMESITISPDGRWLAARGVGTSLAVEYPVLLWDLDDLSASPKRLAHGDRVMAIHFSPDSRWLASGTRGQIAQVWNVSSGAAEGNPIFHPANFVGEVLFSSDSRLLATVCLNGTLRAYDWLEGCPISEEFETGTIPAAVAFTPDGTSIAAIARDPRDDSKSYARVWELRPQTQTQFDLVALTDAATAQRVSTTGSPIACDPYEGWERIRSLTPDLWFSKPPARRSISPAFEASSLRWINDPTIGIEETARSMPAVAMVRAAVSVWNQRNLERRKAQLSEIDQESKEFSAELAVLETLQSEIDALAESASRSYSDDASTCFWLSLQAELVGQMPKARMYIERALELEPSDREVLNQASDVYRSVRALEPEFSVLTRLRALEPQSLRHRMFLGLNRWRAGDRDQAKAEFTDIVDQPEVPVRERAYMQLLLGRSSEALAQWKANADQEQASEGELSSDTMVMLILCYQWNGDAQAAVDWYQRLIEHEPAAADIRVMQAIDLPPDLIQTLSAALEATLAKHPDLRPR